VHDLQKVTSQPDVQAPALRKNPLEHEVQVLAEVQELQLSEHFVQLPLFKK